MRLTRYEFIQINYVYVFTESLCTANSVCYFMEFMLKICFLFVLSPGSLKLQKVCGQPFCACLEVYVDTFHYNFLGDNFKTAHDLVEALDTMVKSGVIKAFVKSPLADTSEEGSTNERFVLSKDELLGEFDILLLVSTPPIPLLLCFLSTCIQKICTSLYPREPRPSSSAVFSLLVT